MNRLNIFSRAGLFIGTFFQLRETKGKSAKTWQQLGACKRLDVVKTTSCSSEWENKGKWIWRWHNFGCRRGLSECFKNWITSLTAQHVVPSRGKAANHNGCHCCQLRTRNSSYNSYLLLKWQNNRSDQRSLELSCYIQQDLHHDKNLWGLFQTLCWKCTMKN